MANKKEISVQINIGANLEDVQKRLTGLQNKLDKLSLPASVRNEFLGLFSTMDRELEKISQKTVGGKLKLVDSASVGKSIEKIDSLYSALIQKFESRGIATAALKQDQNAISAITGALKVYADSTKSILSEEKKLTAEVQKQERAKEALLAKQKEQKVVSDAELAAQKERVSAATKEANAKAKAVTAARQILEEKIANSGGKYKLSDIDEKGSPLRKTKAYKEYKAATETSGAANKIKKSEADKFASMTTFEQQKKDIQEVELRITKAKDKLQEFNNTQKATKEIEAFEEIKRQLAELENIDLSKYGIDLTEIKNIEQLEEALEKVKIAAQNSAKAFGKEYAQEMKDAGTSTNRLEKDVKDATDAVEDLDERTSQINAMQERVKSFLGVSGAAQVMRSALRDAMQTITELDATMTEMAVVTDLSVGDYWNQLPQYSKQASDLGVSINSAYKAATLYYQQGLKSNEVTKISAETLKMARIAGLSAEDATNKMTAALRGFNMELNEISAQRVSDVYSELAAITASDVDEISSAMTKTASIASSAGMEFETTAAFLSQIIETTRESAETAGTALKTVIARFQELKKAPGEIGEVEGEIVDANKIETALRSVGVALRDSSGQFRDLDDVFLELSKKWNTLDTNTQRYIATIAAGSRQQSRFIAMMSDYGRTQQLVTAANNSAGASNKQFEKTLDSLESKLAKLENAWHEFTMGILESDLVKAGVDILTKFLEIINKATNALDGVGNSITKILGVFAIFKMGQKLFEQFKGPLLNFFVDVTEESYKGGVNSMKAFKQGVEDEKNNTQREKQGEQNIKGMKMKEAFAFSAQKRSESQLLRQEIRNDANYLASEYHTYENAKNRIKFDNTNLRVVDQEIANLEMEEADYLAQNHITKNKQGQYVKDGKNKLNKKDQAFLATNADKKAKKISEKSSIEEQINNNTKAVEEYEKIREDLGKKEKQINKNSKDSWEAIGQGIGQAGQGVAAVGSIMSLLGGLLSSLGLEELGDTLSGIGQVITLIGGALMAIPPILTLITTHPIIAVVTAALAIILALVVAIANEVKKNSPEGKLQAAQEAANRAAEAADRATESYENLTNAIDSLSNKYKAIENLTRGTSEWNKAVQDVNQEVIDLINRYPELSKFLESKGGVLTLDLDDSELQQIVVNAQTVAVSAQNAANSAKASAARYKNLADMHNYEKELGKEAFSTTVTHVWEEYIEETKPKDDFWGRLGQIVQGMADVVYGYDRTYATAVTAVTSGYLAQKQTEEKFTLEGEDLEAVATAMAKGDIYLRNGQYVVGDDVENKEYLEGLIEANKPLLAEQGKQILEWGRKVVENSAQISAAAEASANNTKALIQLNESLTPDQQEEAYGYIDALITGELHTEIKQQELDTINGSGFSATDPVISRYVKQIWGEGATWDSEKEQIIDLNGNILDSGIDLNYFKDLLAEERTTERLKLAGESAYGMVETVKQLSNDNYISDTTIERMFSDNTGGLLTQGDLTQIASSGIKESAWVYWENFTDEQKDLFGRDGSKFVEYLEGIVNGATEQFSSATELLAERLVVENFSGVNARAAHDLAKIATSEEMSDNEASTFLAQFNGIMTSEDLTADQKAQFSQLVAAMSEDPTNRENWERIIHTLEESGFDMSSAVGQRVSEFLTQSAKATDSRYTDAYLQNIGVSEKLISHYQHAEGEQLNKFHNTFQQWAKDYKIANDKGKKAEHDLIVQTANKLYENFEESVEEQTAIAEAINEANDSILNKIQQQIDETRSLRENFEAEENIAGKYSKLAYLMSDTSGRNILEQMALEEEIAEAEQQYQDQLIDQAVQRMADDNEKAAFQRERQIKLLSSQLEYQKNSGEFYTQAKTIINEAVSAIEGGADVRETTLGKLLGAQTFTSDWEESGFWTDLGQKISEIVEAALPPKTPTPEMSPPPEIPATSSHLLSLPYFHTRFATGGLADFTGPAWLDGTPSKPEYILNAAQTERFFSLIDVLEGYDTSKKKDTNKGGDNYFDIDISVEKIEDDYDVEKIADKIRRMIYEDASYRNVNTISWIR